MSNMPVSFLTKMDQFDIQMEGGGQHKVKVSLADHPTLADSLIAEFVKLCKDAVVGVDAKVIQGNTFLILSIDTRCIIINLTKLPSFPHDLACLFKSKTMCFVGIGMSTICYNLRESNAFMIRGTKQPDPDYKYQTEIGVELTDLAARALKKHELLNARLNVVANAVGMNIEVAKHISSFDPQGFNHRGFSPEQVKILIHNAYASHVVAKKLLGII